MTDQPFDYSFFQVYFRCVTPLHVGAGQDVGIVDLPVARERTTGYPVIPGSGIRGPLRRLCERAEAANGNEPPAHVAGEEEEEGVVAEERLSLRLFGPETAGPEPRAGCAVVVDARMLLFPVRAAPGIFRWVTCPWLLDRWRRDRAYFLRGANGGPPAVEEAPAEGVFLGPGEGTDLHLEELRFTRGGDWEWQDPPAEVDAGRVVLISDEELSYLVENATIVRQRNRLSTAKTVVRGALFSVEEVPPESVFYGFVGAARERAPEGRPRLNAGDAAAEIQRLAAPEGRAHLVLGGDEAVGSGLTEMFWEGHE